MAITDRQTAEAVFAKVQDAQTAFWHALNELELALGVDLDSVRDYTERTLDDLLSDDQEEDEERDLEVSCAKCGKRTLEPVEDDGWMYCSEDCRDRH